MGVQNSIKISDDTPFPVHKGSYLSELLPEDMAPRLLRTTIHDREEPQIACTPLHTHMDTLHR